MARNGCCRCREPLAVLWSPRVISTACAYYLPGLFSQASTPAPPVVFSVLDNTAPPFTMVMPQARIADGSPGGGCGDFRPG